MARIIKGRDVQVGDVLVVSDKHAQTANRFFVKETGLKFHNLKGDQYNGVVLAVGRTDSGFHWCFENDEDVTLDYRKGDAQVIKPNVNVEHRTSAVVNLYKWQWDRASADAKMKEVYDHRFEHKNEKGLPFKVEQVIWSEGDTVGVNGTAILANGESGVQTRYASMKIADLPELIRDVLLDTLRGHKCNIIREDAP